MEGEPLTILLVEDDPQYTEIVKISFRNKQVANRMYHVSDGEAALDYLFRRGEYADPGKNPRPHVVLLDLSLPGIDGFNVLREIKKSKMLRNIIVVVLATSIDESRLGSAYDCRADGYLLKPVSFSGFTHMMSELGFYWLAWNTRPYNQFKDDERDMSSG